MIDQQIGQQIFIWGYSVQLYSTTIQFSSVMFQFEFPFPLVGFMFFSLTARLCFQCVLVPFPFLLCKLNCVLCDWPTENGFLSINNNRKTAGKLNLLRKKKQKNLFIHVCYYYYYDDYLFFKLSIIIRSYEFLTGVWILWRFTFKSKAKCGCTL